MFGPSQLSRTLQYYDIDDRDIDETQEHRNFLCPFYDLCLDMAADKRWRSFTCKYCPNFYTDPYTLLRNYRAI